MAVAIDKCTVRVRNAHRDDVKVTIIKEKEIKENKFLVYMEMFPSQNLI